ncbi:MAG: hypothetical protein WAW33_03075 [Minisyncoccia bacterium]
MADQIPDNGVDIVNTHLFDELQVWANRLMIKACINPCFYNRGETDKVYLRYKLKSRAEKSLISYKILDEESGTLILTYKAGPEEVETLDIILVAQQGIESVMFESLKALIWYAWFRPLEKEMLKQLSCLSNSEVVSNFFFSHMGEIEDKSTEEMAVLITNMVQTMESYNIETTEVDNSEGAALTEEDKDG